MKVANRLAGETSPYLLQHAGNPVDWFPWGEEAFAAARERDAPLLVSIGYSACHWCHVMERESFEDEATAAVMNARFVNVKVDREERPDVDALYMEAVVAMTGQGGWPMTVFATPDGRPFFGGTYFPPEPRAGMASFRQVLEAVAAAYGERRAEVDGAAGRLTAAIAAAAARASGDSALTPALLDAAVATLERQHDAVNGGFGGAPKFPPSVLLRTLVGPLRDRGGALVMATRTLAAMAAGGIHDQLGGGFHRYAVDGVWLVPHFEKMLYDNALLADAYAAAAVVTGDPAFAEAARTTLRYVDSELTLPGDGLASAEDADTNGVEGLTFVWTPAEVEGAVGDEADARLAMAVYGVSAAGNFEGATVLSRARPLEEAAAIAGVDADDATARLERARAAMLAARRLRPQPARDDKALAAWNGLALAAFANAGRLLDEPAFVDRARRLAAFLLGELSVDGRLLRSWRDGRAKVDGFADDYGAVADGLIALALATGELRWLDEARRLTGLALAAFGGDDDGAFFLARATGEQLVARTRDVDDNPAPSGSSLLASNLLRLGRIYGDADWERRGSAAAAAVADVIGRAPQAFGRLLGVVALAVAPPRELAIVGAPGDPRTAALRRAADALVDDTIVAVVADPVDPLFDSVPLLAGRGLVDGAPAAYVCERFACKRPVTTPAELSALLDGG